MIGGYAIRHTDTAGQVHTWTCTPTSAHWVARWHAQDSGQPTEVLRDDGDGWRVVTTWTPVGDCDLTDPRWSDGDGWPDLDGQPAEGLFGYSADCIEDDCDHCEQPDGCDCSCHLDGDPGWDPDDDWDDDYDPEEDRPCHKPIIDYAAL
jgi:hypothetical protein